MNIGRGEDLHESVRGCLRGKDGYLHQIRKNSCILLLNNYYMQASMPQPPSALHHSIKQATWEKFRTAYRRKFRKEHQGSIFVVLASVVLVEPNKEKFEVIAVGEGTKSLPNCVVDEDNRGDLLSDMHAEMLALRGFRRFLLEELTKGNSRYLEWNQKKGKHSLIKDYEVWLYCSQVFCGDCCISQQKQSFSGAKPLAFLKQQVYPAQKFMQDVLRTKPGRIDLPVSKRSAILSCSDLIGVSNIVGIQGRSLFSSFTPIYLSKIIVDGPQNLKDSIKKGIYLPMRLHRLLNRSPSLILRQIFNIIIDGKERQISSQFTCKQLQIVIVDKGETRDKQGFQLCGIFMNNREEWINGRTGLPEGSSLKNYKEKGKISKFSETSFIQQFPIYKQNQFTFKYDAILDRLKKLFGQWIQGTGL